jgi:hypothetical protein
LKADLSYLTDCGCYTTEQISTETRRVDLAKGKKSKKGLAAEHQLLWGHLMIRSGDINQPWHDKLLHIRQNL